MLGKIKTMVEFTGVYVEPVRNATLSKLGNGHLWQANILGRDVVEAFTKRHYFPSK